MTILTDTCIIDDWLWLNASSLKILRDTRLLHLFGSLKITFEEDTYLFSAPLLFLRFRIIFKPDLSECIMKMGINWLGMAYFFLYIFFSLFFYLAVHTISIARQFTQYSLSYFSVMVFSISFNVYLIKF